MGNTFPPIELGIINHNAYKEKDRKFGERHMEATH
jgi:hypothetical protein